jgi:hypothetical protein
MTLIKSDTRSEFKDSAGRDADGIALVDGDGSHTGTADNPLSTLQIPIDFGSIGNLGTSVGSTVVVENTVGGSTIGFYLGIPDGAVKSEISFDGVHWESSSMRHMSDDETESSLAHSGNFIGSISSARYWRVRVTSELSTVGTVVGRLDQDVAVIENIEFGPPPHRIGYAVQRKSKSYTDAETNTVIWSPPSGRQLAITMIVVNVSGSTDGRIQIFDETNAVDKWFFNAYVEVSTNKTFSQVLPFTPAAIMLAVDNSLKITTTAAVDVDILVVGYEF